MAASTGSTGNSTGSTGSTAGTAGTGSSTGTTGTGSSTGSAGGTAKRAGRTRKRSAPTGGTTSHLVRSDAWAGLRTGDPVAVAGSRLRGATWTFLAQVRNVRSGEEWVEVVGGRGGDRALRSFRPDQVYPVVGRPVRGGARRGRGGALGSAPSLAEAPRLPLGPTGGSTTGGSTTGGSTTDGRTTDGRTG